LPDLEKFDELVKEKLEELKKTLDPEDEGEAQGYASIKSLITNWTDAVRHFDSSLANDSDNSAARHNRDMTMVYLKRLAELLEQDKQETQQTMPEPQQGEGQPQEGEGESEEKKPGESGDEGDEPPGEEGGEGDEKSEKGSGEEEREEPRDQPGKKQDDKEGDDKGPENPDETPEERARRLLKENADLEKGPLTPGRREFRKPEKDW
jgi:Ca-activated chloride channel homolog